MECLCLGNDGTATVDITGGFPPYTISWNTNPIQTGATATGLAPGTYEVTVDDAGACTDPITQMVVVSSTLNNITPTFNQEGPYCEGDAILSSLPSRFVWFVSCSNNWSDYINLLLFFLDSLNCIYFR